MILDYRGEPTIITGGLESAGGRQGSLERIYMSQEMCRAYKLKWQGTDSPLESLKINAV